jgi:hypothetical protein
MPMSRNLEALTSQNPLGHNRPVMGMLFHREGNTGKGKKMYENECYTLV